MLSMIKNLVAKMHKSNIPAARLARERRVRLLIEAMEERLALSAVPSGVAPPTLETALVKETDGSQAAEPEMVCGYKHRGRCGHNPPPIVINSIAVGRPKAIKSDLAGHVLSQKVELLFAKDGSKYFETPIGSLAHNGEALITWKIPLSPANVAKDWLG